MSESKEEDEKSEKSVSSDPESNIESVNHNFINEQRKTVKPMMNNFYTSIIAPEDRINVK